MKEFIKYLVSTYVVSEERAKDLYEKHKVQPSDDPITAAEVIAEEEALDLQMWQEDEDIAYERDDT